MKFIPLFVIVLLCVSGIEQIAAGGFGGGWGCFDSSCHVNVTHEGEVCDTHATMKYSTCVRCHPVPCDADAKVISKANAAKVASASDKAQTVNEIIKEEKKSISTTVTGIQMFTEDDSEWASETMSNSGFGKLIALVNWFYQVSPVLALILLLIAAVLSKLASKADTGKWAITGMFYIVAALFALKLVLVVVSAVKPDLSVIAI